MKKSLALVTAGCYARSSAVPTTSWDSSKPDDETTEELREHLTIARSIDTATLELLCCPIDTMRHLDRWAGSFAPLAYATAQQAFILLDIDDPSAAVEHLTTPAPSAPAKPYPHCSAPGSPQHTAKGSPPPAPETLHSPHFDEANALLPAEHDHPELPFLMFSDVYLCRWRGAVFTRLGKPEAISNLEKGTPHPDR